MEHSFQEVMKQWQRMCKSMQKKNMSCKEDCLLGHNPTCGELEYASLEEINNAETVIMKWAAEHPKPVYETWAEFLKRFGAPPGISVMMSIGHTCTDETYCAAVGYHRWCASHSIPADIAQKLGIEPKEG